MSTTTKFRGVLFGAEYDDPQEWVRAVRAAGYRPGGSRGGSTTRLLGTEVRMRSTDTGKVVRGQVWALAETRGHVWVALENGEYVEMHVQRGTASGWRAEAA